MSSYHFDYTVDTRPMANSIDSVSSKVNETTRAVVAMEAAVVAAQAAGAAKVCKDVNRGFHALMQSQISQKIAQKKSRVEALEIELNQEMKRLRAIQNTMGKDYDRITTRYARLINGLNKALATRIYELDKPVWDFVNRDMACHTNRMNALTATVPVEQTESVTVAQKLYASNLKNDGMGVISVTEKFLRQMNEQKLLTNRILIESVRSCEATHVVPVVISEQVMGENGETNTMVKSPSHLSAANAQVITGAVFENQDSLSWKQEEVNELVDQEFKRLVNTNDEPQRVKDMIAALYQKNDVEVL